MSKQVLARFGQIAQRVRSQALAENRLLVNPPEARLRGLVEL